MDISDNYSRKLIKGKVTATAGIHNMDSSVFELYGMHKDRYEILKAINHTKLFRIIWYAVFLSLAVLCLILEPKSWLYVIDLLVLLINIDLATKGKVIGVYVGIAECFLYMGLSYMSHLYGEIIKMMLFNIPLNILAIVNWSKSLKKQKLEPKKDDVSIVIRKLDKKSYAWIIPLLLVACVGSYFFLNLLGTTAIIFSTGAFVCSITYKILNGLRYKESWFFAIFNNLISAIMWLQVLLEGNTGLTELPEFIAMLAFFINDFYGYHMWKSMYRKVAVNGAEIFSKRKIKINKIIKLRRKYQKLNWAPTNE